MLPLALGGMALGAGMSGLGSILGHNSTKGAQNSINRTGQQLTGMYQPYMDYGNRAMQPLEQQYSQLMNDPNSIYQMLSQGYTQSPGYDYRMQASQNAANMAASAGGMLGTNQHQLNSMGAASGIAGEDFDKYLSTLLGLYGTGLEGTQGQFNTGASMMQGLGGNLTGLRNSASQLQYAGGQNTANALGGLGGMAMQQFSPLNMAISKMLEQQSGTGAGSKTGMGVGGGY